MVSSEDQDRSSEVEARASVARILVYSDHVQTRSAVRGAIGHSLGPDLPTVEWHEAATLSAALDAVRAGGLDLLVLDGEAGKAGGMGLARQVKDEIYDAPPVLLLIARPADAWLASWSEAEKVVAQPIDPFELAETVAGMLRVSA
ncbi:hypothetical protein Q6348_12200 [Isoptericola sp. b441]|uniref:Response regulatory domain-containing protein n=1 Tax=Actinotalea lenta TaxID=3064654 RepID=A0ABT9DAM3_9CELL|nr:hypothetical protein [Isoptericola sp. b441]MDO8107957.1 hypothetical protein [Isoptericola sp. b441]